MEPHQREWSGSRAAAPPGKGLLTLAAAAILFWLALALALAAGRQTFYFRDLYHLFVPLKAFGAAELAQGSIPATNPTWALGQAFRGNPNATAFYPTNLLYLVLPFWPAFNLHLALHWLLGAGTMFLLARSFAASREGATLAALAYAGSGWMLSALTFYNVSAVAAWWPLVLWGTRKGGTRGIAIGGLACGMAFLAGEPVMAVLGLAPLLATAITTWGVRRGLLVAAGIAGAGLLVAMPQIVATARVLPGSFRGAHGIVRSHASFYSLHPLRLLELLIPFPFGWPGYGGGTGVWAREVLPHVPFYLCLYFGLPAAMLALYGVRRRPFLAGFAVASVFLAWLGGLSPEWVQRLGFGLARSPEKFLFWLALALPLLAALGFDRWRAGVETTARRAVLIALAGLTTAALAAWVASTVATSPQSAGGLREAARQLLLGGLLVALLFWALARRRWLAILAVEALALLQLQPLLLLDRAEFYVEPAPWAKRLGPGTPVVVVERAYPPWRLDSVQPESWLPDPAQRIQLEASALVPGPGVLHGLTYPAASDLDGMHHQNFTYLLLWLAQGSWAERIAWCRLLGVEALVSPEEVSVPGLALLDRQQLADGVRYLYRIEGAAPPVWSPTKVAVEPSGAATFARVAALDEPTELALVPRPVAHRGAGVVHLLAAAADRVEVEVDGPGGLLVLRRAYLPIWEAVAGEEKLPTVPVDLGLLGVEVPPGKHRVVLSISARPELVAGGLALAGGLGLFFLALRGRFGVALDAQGARGERR